MFGGRGGCFSFDPSALRVRTVCAGKDAFGDGIAPKMTCCHAEYKRKQMLGIESSFGDDLALAGKQLWLEGSFSLAMHFLIHFHVLSVVPMWRWLP